MVFPPGAEITPSPDRMEPAALSRAQGARDRHLGGATLGRGLRLSGPGRHRGRALVRGTGRYLDHPCHRGCHGPSDRRRARRQRVRVPRARSTSAVDRRELRGRHRPRSQPGVGVRARRRSQGPAGAGSGGDRRDAKAASRSGPGVRSDPPCRTVDASNRSPSGPPRRRVRHLGFREDGEPDWRRRPSVRLGHDQLGWWSRPGARTCAPRAAGAGLDGPGPGRASGATSRPRRRGRRPTHPRVGDDHGPPGARWRPGG